MASEVDICNLSLSHIGDEATVSSINPPEASFQAGLCARFYPIARDSLLQMHNWNFGSKRVNLAQVTNVWPEWEYAYAVPGDCVTIVSVLPPDAANDYATQFVPTDSPSFGHNYSPLITAGQYVPQPYAVEADTLGAGVIYTNQASAMLRYQSLVSDPTKFTPLFVMTLSWHLASMLAGPIIKGDIGSAEAKRCLQMMAGYLSQARTSDSNMRNIKVEHIVPWSAGR